MTCMSSPCFPYWGAPCALPCPPRYLPSCSLECLPLEGPTGATGPRASSFNVDAPAFLVEVALNAPTVALTVNTTTIVPFNLIVSGSNTAGAARFNTAAGNFTVLIPGIYKVDFGISFSSAAAAVAGTGITAAVRQNLTSLSNATFQFPVTSTAISTNSVNSSWTGLFGIGDVISMTVLSTIAVATTLNGPAISGVAPFNTLLTIRSLF